MEQHLINELIRLLCKSGCETFVGNFQKDIKHDKTTEQWSSEEIVEAANYMRYINEYFGKEEAIAIIKSLIAKFDIHENDFQLRANIIYDKEKGRSYVDKQVGTKF